MADILSQDEIVSLLDAVSAGEVETAGKPGPFSTGAVRVHDFTQPAPVSDRQRSLLQMLHESYARRASYILSSQLSTTVDVQLQGFEQTRYSDFESTIPHPSTLAMIRCAQFNGLALIVVQPMLGFVVIERLLGGMGAAPKTVRPFSDIEQSLIDEVLVGILKDLNAVWESEVGQTFDVIDKSSDPQLLNFVGPGDRVVAVTLEVRVQDQAGLLNFCYPLRVIQEAERLIRLSDMAQDEEQFGADAMRRAVTRVPIDVMASLGSVEIPVRDVVTLKAGDVLVLDRNIQEPLDLTIEGRLRFKGYLGVHLDRLAVAVTQRV